MKRLLVCQHDAGESLDSWNSFLQSRGVRINYADFSKSPRLRPRLEGYDGLVLLGGSANVREARRRPHLSHEMKLVRQAATRNLPVLGICLGGQLVAKALGGKVAKCRRPETGWHQLSLTTEGARDPLFKNAPNDLHVFQWHEYEFSLPDGASLSATSRGCRNQAFRLGPNIFATQFHFEVDRPTIDRWLDETPPKKAAAIRAESRTRLAASRKFGRSIWKAFAALL